MADDRNGNLVRRRTVYRQTMDRLIEYVENDLEGGPPPPGGGPPPRPVIPDTTEWSKQRQSTISTLNELREKLDNTCVYSNYGKGVGDGLGIAGAAAAIVGAFMALHGHSSADKVMNVGNLLKHSGALVEGVSNATEKFLSIKYLREVEAVLKTDQELSRPLFTWLLTSANLDMTIKDLFGVGLSSPVLSIVLDTIVEFSRVFVHGKDFNTTLDLLKRGKYSVHIGNDVTLECLQKLFKEFAAVPALAGTFSKALSVLIASTSFLQVARACVSVYQSFVGEGSAELPLLKGGINPQIPTAGDVSWFCGFNGIYMAVKIVSLTNVVRVIRSGKSKYSDALKQLSDLLQVELDTMKALNT